MIVHPYLKLCRDVQGIHSFNPETMPHDPTLFIDGDATVCYFGYIGARWASIHPGLRAESVLNVRLFRKNRVSSIEIKPNHIIFTLAKSGDQVFIPHTPKTFKELVEIYGKQ